MTLTFHKLVASRYLRMEHARSSGVFRLPLVLAVLLAITASAWVYLKHTHVLALQEFRAEHGGWIQSAQLILIVALVLVGTFSALIRRLTIFTTISVYGLFIGSGALVIVLSVMSGFEGDLKRKILGSNAHIVVTKIDQPFTDYVEAQKKLVGLPGVLGVTAYLTNEVMVASSSNNSGVVIKGIDPETVGQVTDLSRNIDLPRGGGLEYLEHPEKLTEMGSSWLLKHDDDLLPGRGKRKPLGELEPKPEPKPEEGELPPAPAPPPAPRRVYQGVIIGRELAKNLRVYLGDDINIVSPFGGIGPTGPMPKSKPFRVAGIFFSGMFEYDTKNIYVTVAAAQKFFNMQGEVTGMELKVPDPDRTEPVVARVQAALGPAFEVRDWKQLNRSLFSALKIEKILMFVLLTFIILVAAFSIIANGTMLVLEKGGEIAILKSMGATDGAVLGVFMLLGLLIGGLGTVGGILVGIAGCLALGRFGLPLNPDVYYITQLPVRMNPYEIATVFFAALAIALLATLYPAWMAARLRPVEGLRDAQR